MLNAPKDLWKLHQSTFIIFSISLGELIWKISPLVILEVVGVFVNTLTADGKYPVRLCENLQLPTQMQLP